MAKDTNITMEVDTRKINEHNVNEHVYFHDDHSSREKGKPQNFISKIEKGGKVLWYGKSTPDASGIIHITEIGRKSVNGEVELLKEHPRHSKEGNAFVARVKDQFIAGEESYYVKFKIGDSDKVYLVDPKLEMASIR